MRSPLFTVARASAILPDTIACPHYHDYCYARNKQTLLVCYFLMHCRCPTMLTPSLLATHCAGESTFFSYFLTVSINLVVLHSLLRHALTR